MSQLGDMMFIEMTGMFCLLFICVLFFQTMKKSKNNFKGKTPLNNPETKSSIRARINELERLLNSVDFESSRLKIQNRIAALQSELGLAQEDLSASIIESHKAICRIKHMGEKEAYGNDPAVYYTLGICGESGEMANAIVKAQRNGVNKEKVLEAVCSELPDVIIYSYVLAYVLDIDLTKLVNEKVDVVIKRANDGYYGGKLKR